MRMLNELIKKYENELLLHLQGYILDSKQKEKCEKILKDLRELKERLDKIKEVLNEGDK